MQEDEGDASRKMSLPASIDYFHAYALERKLKKAKRMPKS